MEESLESPDEKPAGVPQVVKILAILTYVGNGLWALIFLGVFFWFMADSDAVAAELKLKDLPMGPVAIFILILELMFLFCILGAYSMASGRRAGFWIYLVGNAIWILLNILPGQVENFIVALISMGFTIGFIVQLKKLD